MVKKHDDVMSAVADALEKNPDADLQTLYEVAKKVDAGVKDLTIRQFNARYPLQIKRKRSAATGGRKRAASKGRQTRKRRTAQARREELRKVFFEFAEELAAAEHQAQVVGVLTQTATYIERVEKVFEKR